MSAVKSQYKNQRLFRPGKQRRQQHLLEVSIRRDRERAIRFKAVSWFLLKLITFVALILTQRNLFLCGISAFL